MKNNLPDAEMNSYRLDEIPDGHSYAVMKKSTKIDVAGMIVELPSSQSFIPVFDTYEEAYKHSSDGKYQIVVIKEQS